MPNICLTIAYDGTDYSGWQLQKNSKTIQGEIEKALKRILREKVKLISSGRTDSGVHAKAQIVNFNTTKNIPLRKIQSALNSNLPKSISVNKVKEVHSEFHAQFKAKSKLYRYTILNSESDDPFLRRYYYKVPFILDVSKMKKASKALLGKHDFKAFQKKKGRSKIKDTVRNITKIAIFKKKNFIYINIEADGFLHNMVRNIVGTLIEVGRGYFHPEKMKKILLSKRRETAGPTAPAKGLSLIKVKYK